MQPYCNSAGLVAICVFVATQVRCPHCGDSMVAPVSSEFVEGVEIRHHWECDSCGEASSNFIPLTRD
jgi:transposase-like protein